MRVLKYIEPRKVEITELACPRIGDGEVLVQTRACGICATDVKTFLRGHPLIPAGAVLGHEMSGVIVESRVAEWRVGERVVIAPYVSCGECVMCRRGHFTLCARLWEAAVDPGGFSEFLRVPPRLVQHGLFRLPDTLDFVTASLAEPLACVYHGLDALCFERGESLLIIGDGPMGLLQTLVARAMGATQITLAGLTPERLTWGARHADHIINVTESKLSDAVKELTEGKGFDKVLVSVGQVEIAEQALAFVARGGAVNFFAGLPRDARVTIDPNRIHYDEISLVGTFGFATDHFRCAVEALARGAFALDGFITRTVTLNEMQDAFADSAAYIGIKTVAVFES